jgi:predicted ATPase
MILSPHPLIALTGGPGGGKTTLIEQLSCDPAWAGRFAALPEAIFTLRHSGLSMDEKPFQRAMLHMQLAMEDGLRRALDPHDHRLILCHRGALDPLAYWLDRGWDEQEFFTFTGTRRARLYARYTAVLHLVTAADGAAEHYARWPDNPRGEMPEDAIRLDHLLQRVWGEHPNYYRLDNAGRDWEDKFQAACEILERCGQAR